MGISLWLVVMLALLLGAAARVLLQRINLPYSVALLLIGMLVGILPMPAAYQPLSDELIHLDPHLLLFVFLPPLIYESAQAIEPHLFRRLLSQISFLAIPGLLFSTVVTAWLCQHLLGWSWALCLLFGALISATDPVAVVSLLRELCQRKRMETLIEGESLLNDGTAIVLVGLFTALLLGEHTSVWSAGLSLAWVLAISSLVGWIWGSLLMAAIRRISNQPLIEVTLSIASAYLVFYVAEFMLHTSGVVAVVVLALMSAVQGRASFSPQVYHFLHQFWDMVAFLANTLLFLFMGYLVMQSRQWFNWDSAVLLLTLYASLLLVRGIMLIGFKAIFKALGQTVAWSKLAVLWWGGLRGAVALLLAISASHQGVLGEEQKQLLLLLTAGIVVLTIVVNGGTMRWLLLFLKLDRLPPAKQATLGRASLLIQKSQQEKCEQLKANPRCHQVDWHKFLEQLPAHPGAEIAHEPSADDLQMAYLRRLLESEREHYWQQHSAGWLSPSSAQILAESVDKALDDVPRLARPELIDRLHLPESTHWLSGLPGAQRVLQRLYRRRFLQSYELAQGFLSVMQSLREPAASLAPNPAAQADAIKEIEENQKTAKAYCELIQSYYPTLAEQVEAQIATRYLLEQEREQIHKLCHQGVLSNSEAEQLEEQVEQRLHSLGKSQ